MTSPAPPSADAQHVLLHTLGVSQPGKVEQYRNHYVAGPGGSPALRECEAAGLMEQRRRPGFLPGDSTVWAATDKGKVWAAAFVATRETAHRKSQTRGQRRYLRWREIDEFCDVSFGDWLRAGEPTPGEDHDKWQKIRQWKQDRHRATWGYPSGGTGWLP